MLAEDADGGIFLVKQYRHAVDEEIYEIPAGLVEEGESPEETAARELQEEIGRRPGRMERIAELYSSPGFTTEKITMFYATELSDSKLPRGRRRIHKGAQILARRACVARRGGRRQGRQDPRRLLLAPRAEGAGYDPRRRGRPGTYRRKIRRLHKARARLQREHEARLSLRPVYMDGVVPPEFARPARRAGGRRLALSCSKRR